MKACEAEAAVGKGGYIDQSSWADPRTLWSAWVMGLFF